MYQNIDVKHIEPQIPHLITSNSLHCLYQQLKKSTYKEREGIFSILSGLQKHDGPHLLPCSAAYEASMGFYSSFSQIILQISS